MVGCEVTWGELLWPVMSFDVRSCDGLTLRA